MKVYFDSESMDNAKLKTRTLPIVRRDPNKKAISVTNRIGPGRIAIKIIALDNDWLEWEEICLRGGRISLADIEQSITKRIPAHVLPDIKEFAQNLPEVFSEDFYAYFIYWANTKNPHHERGKKPRGVTYEQMTPDLKRLIQYSAMQLYVYLRHWLKQDESKWPPELKRLKIEVEKHPKIVTLELIEDHFKIGLLDHISDYDNFYDKNIDWNPYLLNEIEKRYESINYQLQESEPYEPLMRYLICLLRPSE